MQISDDSHGWFAYETTAKDLADTHARSQLLEKCYYDVHGQLMYWSVRVENECLWRKNYRDLKEYNCFATASGDCRVSFQAEDD